jgi:hypothetical protein
MVRPGQLYRGMTQFSLQIFIQIFKGIEDRRNDRDARFLIDVPRSIGSIVECPRDDDAELSPSGWIRPNPMIGPASSLAPA